MEKDIMNDLTTEDFSRGTGVPETMILKSDSNASAQGMNGNVYYGPQSSMNVSREKEMLADLTTEEYLKGTGVPETMILESEPEHRVRR